MVILNSPLLNVGIPLLFDLGNMIRHAPEHLLHALGRLAPAAYITAYQHLAGIVGQIDFGELLRGGMGWGVNFSLLGAALFGHLSSLLILNFKFAQTKSAGHSTSTRGGLLPMWLAFQQTIYFIP